MLGAGVAIGAVLRVFSYLGRDAFWSDEAALGLNIVERGFAQLGRPFLHAQVAPYLFVAGEKVVSLFAGSSEASLRAWSLVSGVLLLPLCFALGRRLGGTWAGGIALAAAASNALLVYYSTELKPYGTDALLSAVLTWLSLSALERRPHALLSLGATGVVAPWLSLPAVFVLAGSGAALLAQAIAERRRELRAWLALFAVGAAWLLSFALHYTSFLQLTAADAEYMQRYWTWFDGFPPEPLVSLGALRWFGGKFFYLFALIAGERHGLRYLAAAAWLFGLWQLGRQQRALPWLFALPMALLPIAAAAHAYVIADRLVLYLMPLLIVPCAIGTARAASVRIPVSRWAVLGAVLALCCLQLLSVHAQQQPTLDRDIRTAVAYLHEQRGARDQLVVEHRVAWIYEFYAHRVGMSQTFREVETLGDPDGAQRSLLELAGAGRVWVLVPTLSPLAPKDAAGSDGIVTAARRVLRVLTKLGERVDAYDGGNVMLYLYELSAKPPEHARAALP